MEKKKKKVKKISPKKLDANGEILIATGTQALKKIFGGKRRAGGMKAKRSGIGKNMEKEGPSRGNRKREEGGKK